MVVARLLAGKLDEMLGYIGADATLKSPVKYKPVERGDFELSGRDEARARSF